MQNGNAKVQENNKSLIQKIYGNAEEKNTIFEQEINRNVLPVEDEIEQEEFDDDDEFNTNYLYAEAVDDIETLSLEAKEIELIKKSLKKNKGKRKAAADELGISERTLYRKIKQFDL
jgi:transcriptional regulator with PAS, ATPase and Fis domain